MHDTHMILGTGVVTIKKLNKIRKIKCWKLIWSLMILEKIWNYARDMTK